MPEGANREGTEAHRANVSPREGGSGGTLRVGLKCAGAAWAGWMVLSHSPKLRLKKVLFPS
jgi:hypothetical protein